MSKDTERMEKRMKNENGTVILFLSDDSARCARLQSRMGLDYTLEMLPTADQDRLSERLIREQPRLLIADADCFPGIVAECASIFGGALFVSGVRPGVLVLTGDDWTRASLPDDGHWLWTDEADVRRRAELMLAVQRIRYGDAPGESQSVMHSIQRRRVDRGAKIAQGIRRKKRIRRF